MQKIDYKKELKEFYGGRVNDFQIVHVPTHQFLMIDGQGSPNDPPFTTAIEALYPVAYTLKFTVKNTQAIDYGVMPLEGLFWSQGAEFDALHKDQWLWTLMIMQPPFITNTMVEAALESVKQKKNQDRVDDIRFESYAEGRAAQVMYVGPYADEGPTIAQLHEFIADHRGELTDNRKQKHHEIYLSDARRTDPARLKTIIRQPF
jgi:hypothetical protein